MSGPIDITWPRGGANDNWAHDKQPPETTPEIENCRNVVNGRDQGGKRGGKTKHHNERLAEEKIQDLGSVTKTNKGVNYFQDETTLWAKGKADAPWVEMDEEGNSYWISGPAAITKESADGVEVYTFAVPVPSSASLSVLDVDEGQNVYTGVGGTRAAPAGVIGSPEPANGLIVGDMDDARLYKLQHAFRNNDDETEPELEVAWELTTNPEDPGPTLRGLVTFLRVRGAKLYTIQQDNKQWRTWYVVYDSIHAGVPVEVLARDDIPYPGSMLDADPKGNVAICSEAFNRRGENPAYPEGVAYLVAWDPATKDIDSEVTGTALKHRVYAHYKLESKYLVTTGGLDPEDGSEVIQWLDASGNGRHIKFNSADGKKAAIYRAHGLGGKPELYFNGTTMMYATGTSPSGDADFRDASRGIFPTYKDPDDSERSSQYAVIAMMRPDPKVDGVSDLKQQYPVWSQEVVNPNLTDVSSLLINRGVLTAGNMDTLAATQNYADGAVSLYIQAESSEPAGEFMFKGEGSATGRSPASYAPSTTNPFGPFNNGANALLVSIIACNGVDSAVPVSGTSVDDFHTRSLLRIWGKPIDRFQEEADVNYSLARQFLGGSADSDFSTLEQHYRGGISEIIVLDRKDVDRVGADGILSHPAAPDSQFGNMVGQVTILNQGAGVPNTTGALAFVGGGPAVPASGTWTAVNSHITTVTLTSTGVGYLSRPTVTATGAGGGSVLQAGMDYEPGSKLNSTIMEKIEGYLAWKHGVAYLLHSAGFYVVQRMNTNNTAGTYSWSSPHPYFYAPDVAPFVEDQGPPTNEDAPQLYRFSHRGEVLTYLDASGKIRDILSHELNGIGLGCRFNKDGTILYAVGNTAASDGTGSNAPADIAALRKILVNEDGTLSWKAADGGGALFSGLRMSGQRCGIKVDAADNVYVPCNAPLDITDAFTLAVISPLGVLIHGFSEGAGIENQGTYCVAIPRAVEKADLEPFTADYEGDLTYDIAEDVALAGRAETYQGVPLEKAVRKYRLVLSTPNNNPPRSRIDLRVTGGSIVRSNEAALVIPAGGAGVLGTGYVHSVEAFEKHYFTDGATDWVYDPKLDTVERWTATRGTLPPRCRIMEFWRESVIRTADQGFPRRVSLSRSGKPDDWDMQPPVPTFDQAGEFSIPDRVTGFVSYSNENAIVGGDHTLHRLDGDPRFGGRFSTVSTSVGMAFGRAWAIDGTQRIWFIDNTGQLRAMSGPGGQPEPVSRDKIGARLQALDFTRYYVRMAYDRNREGLWIMPLPFGVLEDERIETYYYDMRAGAFFPDYIDQLAGQVTALHVIDGDEPGDRRVLFGHGDGYVTYADDAATKDNNVPIRARALLGPFKADGAGREIRTQRLGMILGSNTGGLTWNLYASATPDNKGSIKRSGSFGPGNNYIPSAKSLGAYFWIELLQTTELGTFAFERAWLTYEVAGDRQKVRP